MREIKFRAFNEEFKIMSEPFTLMDSLNGLTQGCDFRGSEIMQYTGLKDKNGKEIYEGDIVMHKVFSDKGQIGVVKFEKYKKGDEDQWTGNIGFYIDWVNKATRVDMGYWTDGYEDVFLEVIGNIYENPNLLIK